MGRNTRATRTISKATRRRRKECGSTIPCSVVAAEAEAGAPPVLLYGREGPPLDSVLLHKAVQGRRGHARHARCYAQVANRAVGEREQGVLFELPQEAGPRN